MVRCFHYETYFKYTRGGEVRTKGANMRPNRPAVARKIVVIARKMRPQTPLKKKWNNKFSENKQRKEKSNKNDFLNNNVKNVCSLCLRHFQGNPRVAKFGNVEVWNQISNRPDSKFYFLKQTLTSQYIFDLLRKTLQQSNLLSKSSKKQL